MSTSLRKHLDDLASTFTLGVLHAIRSASIEDLLAESGGGRRLGARALATTADVLRGGRRRAGRLPRRSAADIGEVIDRIVALVKQSPKGMRAEQIRQQLDMQAKEMPRPLREAVAAGRLSRSGQKRATTYFAKGATTSRAAAPARKGRKTAARKAGKRKAAKKAK